MKPQVTLYTRAGCSLCEDAKQAIVAARQRVDFDYAEIDIDFARDPDILRMYDHEVPVITINRRKAFKYRVDMNEFLKKLVATV